MARGLLDLPVEIRLNIYKQLFQNGTTMVEGGTQTKSATFLPAKAILGALQPRSGQLLRVCKTFLYEAQPILYASTTFCTRTEAFAGKLPTKLSDGCPVADKVQHLVWQLSCDMMKHFYPEDFEIKPQDLARLESLELRCQAENWKGSYCGDWCDREAFIKGSTEIVEYSQNLRRNMEQDGQRPVFLVEDRSQLARGRMVLRMQRKRPCLRQNEIMLDG